MDDRTNDTHQHQEVIEGRPLITVRPEKEVATRQKLPYFVGISGETAGTAGLSMHLVVVPPGGKADPHSHRGFETSIYVLEGRVE
ncbi:MAG: cupin, partial [Chloroflexota bacterium]